MRAPILHDHIFYNSDSVLRRAGADKLVSRGALRVRLTHVSSLPVLDEPAESREELELVPLDALPPSPIPPAAAGRGSRRAGARFPRRAIAIVLACSAAAVAAGIGGELFPRPHGVPRQVAQSSLRARDVPERPTPASQSTRAGKSTRTRRGEQRTPRRPRPRKPTTPATSQPLRPVQPAPTIPSAPSVTAPAAAPPTCEFEPSCGGGG